MLLKLSEKIIEEHDLQKVGVIGLGLEDSVVDRHLRNNRNDITMAVLGVVKTWRRTQPDSTVAYTKLCEALREVEMKFLIEEVLK